MTSPAIVWFRQDLRLCDQAAIVGTAADGPVLAIYVLDDETPGDWRMGGATRWWLHHSLTSLGAALAERGVQLVLRRGIAVDEVARLAEEIDAISVHALRHYEPWWQEAEVALALKVDLHLHDGALLANPRQIQTGTGGRYRIFTPFWRALRDLMPPAKPHVVPDLVGTADLIASDDLAAWHLLPTQPDWAAGFADWTPGEAGARAALDAFLPKITGYDHDRNLPAIEGSSRLSPHLHHGEISAATVWHAACDAKGDSEPFLREIGWRDFTSNVIDERPDYGDHNGRKAYDAFPWRKASDELDAWQRGQTGYPIVDAGMRQLWGTGWMHNRVRMITASFLIKHLLIDWRIGERWFWDCLVDADFGNNAVNWQWVAGTGDDSSPFGRIMAPLSQSVKFDAAGYIRRWVPELAVLGDDVIHDPHEAGIETPGYPAKLIGHRDARVRALAAAGKVRAG